MKHVVFLCLALGLLVISTSCTKNFTCTCTSFNAGTPDSVIAFPFTNVKKEEAQEACTATEAAYQLNDPNASCSLH
jgi:hypothetical protein